MGNNNRNDRFSPPAVGGISLLVAFAVLCLTIFALLCGRMCGLPMLPRTL